MPTRRVGETRNRRNGLPVVWINRGRNKNCGAMKYKHGNLFIDV